MRIGIFDSGMGGLTVLKNLLDRYYNNEYIYYGDTKNVPYGNKSIEELKVLSSNIIDFLISKNVDMIIIACGTISSNISDYLRNKYSIKIIDIISPTIKYINESNYNKIGVLATHNTINSRVFSKNTNKDIKEVECPLFVPIIEKNQYDKLDECLEMYLNNLKDRDLIILGCTHYPIIKNEIQNYLKDSTILNMADNISILNGEKNSVELYFSYIDDTILNNINKIMKPYNYLIKNIE